MEIAVFQIITGLVLLYLGGESLVRGAVVLSNHLGMSPLAVGLTVVALGTSTPELAVSLSAALGGVDDISIANVIGSNIANIALILGLSAAIHPMVVDPKVFRLDAPLMILSSLVLFFMLQNNLLSRLEGSLLTVGLLLYIGFTLREARQGTRALEQEFSAGAPSDSLAIWFQPFLVILGIALLVTGGNLLVDGASGLAMELGMSPRVMGLTIVAVGTSLPELTTSLIAALRGYGNMAIGNIIGSNIFNVLGILGVTALVKPLEPGDISLFDHGLMLGLCCVLLVFLYTRSCLDRREGTALFMVYLGYSGWLLVQ